jgi:hypothetical protein
MLLSMGYQKISDRRWFRGSQKVILCLVDDFGVNRDDWSLPPDQWFDADTTVITDNHMPFATNYQILKLPLSYFGGFNYVPADQNWAPTRRFNLSVNRLDSQRQLILLELIKQSGGVDQVQQLDHVNFNARIAGNEHTAEDAQHNFAQCWTQLNQLHNTEYVDWFAQTLSHIPVKNHALTVEQTQVGVYLNLVIETYAGDATVAFSEKIFRALVTPAPCILYSGKHTVSYLASLGFDTLNDIINHRYDVLVDNKTASFGDKFVEYLFTGADAYNTLSSMDPTQLKHRCQLASKQNQAVLEQMKQSVRDNCYDKN